jgi:hypothetical protein
MATPKPPVDLAASTGDATDQRSELNSLLGRLSNWVDPSKFAKLFPLADRHQCGEADGVNAGIAKLASAISKQAKADQKKLKGKMDPPSKSADSVLDSIIDHCRKIAKNTASNRAT